MMKNNFWLELAGQIAFMLVALLAVVQAVFDVLVFYRLMAGLWSW